MHSKVCHSSVVYMNHPGRICGGSSPEMTSPKVTGNDITGIGNEREIISRAFSGT